jgi:hypothetical protein
METVKNIAKNYYKPTPTFWRKVGDAMLTVGTTVTGISAFTMPPIVTAIAAGLTCLGKIITNFATK